MKRGMSFLFVCFFLFFISVHFGCNEPLVDVGDVASDGGPDADTDADQLAAFRAINFTYLLEGVCIDQGVGRLCRPLQTRSFISAALRAT